MTNQPDRTPDIYALLIGIDGYQPNRLYKNLKGCFRDINLVADYLLKTLKIPSEKIFKLTSPNPEVAETIETKDPEPTYENIVAQFHAITEIAQPGEQVYIHYSGHGGRMTTIYPELKGNDQQDEGIVPMDIGNEGGRYLRDVELATLLKRMTDKGLIVTVIMDSCHSGEATRGDDVAIRGMVEIDTAPRDSESLVAPRQELIENWLALTDETVVSERSRTAASITPGHWLPQSKDYALLAACRPSEYAFEYAVSGKERHGALTYWMIDTLTSSPSGLTYKTLHDRVSAKIQSKFPQQMPMLVGESDRFVFGVDRGSLQYAVNVLEVIEEEVTEAGSEPKKIPKQVRLDAGMENGLSPGYRFAIYGFGTTDFTQKNQQLAIVEIAKVGASDAWANVIEVLRQDKIDQGSPAVMLSAPVDLVRGVRLFKKEVGEKDNQLNQAIKDREDAALKAVEAALAGNGWLKLADAQQKEDYLVAVNQKGEYEICIGTPIENLTPALKIDDSDAPQKVVKRLVHLVKYQAIQQLSNQFSDLTNKLEVELLTQPNWQPGMPKKPQPFPDPTNLVVKSGEYAFLRIKNTSSQVLNVAVLDLESNWAVSRIQLQIPEGIFYPFDPNQEMLIPLAMKLPDTGKSSKGAETLKVFATVKPNDFRWLELPSLEQEIDQKSATLIRGENPLGQFMAAVGADVDTQPEIPSYRATAIFDPSQEWTTKEIQISIVR
jgi:Caspase domain